MQGSLPLDCRYEAMPAQVLQRSEALSLLWAEHASHLGAFEDEETPARLDYLEQTLRALISGAKHA